MKQFWNDYGAPMAIFLTMAAIATAGLWVYIDYKMLGVF